MTSKQESYEKMSLASVIYLNANGAITSTLPQFALYFGNIQSANAQIELEKAKQEADKSGDTEDKKQLRESLISQAVEISRRVVAYAINVNDNVLRNLVNYKESDLKKTSDQRLVSCCQVIRENAEAKLASLTEYGVTAAMIVMLQTTTTSFNGKIPTGRVSTADSGESTQKLVDLFQILRTNWGKIDALVEMVHTSQPYFYDEYMKVRRVIPAGSSSMALMVKTVNALSGEPEPNVAIALTPVNDDLKLITASGKNKISKKTAKAGGCYYKNLVDGTYSVDAKKPGLKPVSKTVSVVSGERAVLEILMEQV